MVSLSHINDVISYLSLCNSFFSLDVMLNGFKSIPVEGGLCVYRHVFFCYTDNPIHTHTHTQATESLPLWDYHAFYTPFLTKVYLGSSYT